jgi:hypothetical protein
VHAMAGGAVGYDSAIRRACQAVIAVGVGRNAVGGQVVAQCQAFIAVATPAGDHRDAGCIYQRSRLFRRQDQVLAVAITAHRRTGYTPTSWLVHAHFRDKSSRCRSWHCPQVAGIFQWLILERASCEEDSVAPVAVGTGCGSAVSIHDGSSMHALPIKFDRMREWNFVPRRNCWLL